MKKLFMGILVTVFCLFLGMGTYLLQKEYIVIYREPSSTHTTPSENATRSIITHYTLVTEQGNLNTTTELRTVTDAMSTDILVLLQQWTHLLCTVSHYPSSVQPHAALLTPHENTLYVSWNQHPLPQAWSTAKKMAFMEALAQTIHDAYPTITALQILVNHQHTHDDQLDLAHAWPILEIAA